ncbi:MAG: aminopeptidase [Gammaproteobacteria bacterium]
MLAATCLLLGGCNLAYYGQAINGELKILRARRPLQAVIADPTTPAAVRTKLKLVLTARHFASAKLDLPKGKGYTSYVALKRSYPVWVVYAAPEFSLTPKHWCFPFAGCVPYRGYFHKKDAEAFAAGLARQGNDVLVTGAPAYSTLGWFSDPVYSSMLQWGKVELAGMLFHELAHQKLYIENAPTFNESFADTVEAIGVARFFVGRDPGALEDWRTGRKADRATAAAVKEARASLAVIYGSKAADGQKREEKQAEFGWLTGRYRTVGKRYGIRYSSEWLATLNNASLAQMVTYDRWVPAFKHLLRCENGDLAAFYKAAARIGALPAEKRTVRLEKLAASNAACFPLRSRIRK